MPFRAPDDEGSLFPLRASASLRSGLFAGAACIAVSLLISLATGRPWVLCSGGLAPLVFFLLGGGVRSVRVSPGQVVLRFWLRPMRTLENATLRVQQLPEELVLVDGRATYAVDAAAFRDGDFASCVALLKAHCPGFVEKRALRERR